MEGFGLPLSASPPPVTLINNNNSCYYNKAAAQEHFWQIFGSPLSDKLKKVSRLWKLNLHISKLNLIEFRISTKVLVCLLLSVEIFCLWSTNKSFTFSFQKHKMSREFCLHSLEVGIEAIAIRIISFRFWAPVRQQPCVTSHSST